LGGGPQGHRARLLGGKKLRAPKGFQKFFSREEKADLVILGNDPLKIRELLLDKTAGERHRPGLEVDLSGLGINCGRVRYDSGKDALEIRKDPRVHEERAFEFFRKPKDGDALDRQAIPVGGGKFCAALFQNDVHPGEGQTRGFRGLEGGKGRLGDGLKELRSGDLAQWVGSGFGRLG
jgi:hypothetical protein